MNKMRPKQRRARRTPKKNWTEEVIKGNITGFYDSRDWDMAREAAMIRDKKICQFYKGAFSTPQHKTDKVKLVPATHCHHIKPLKEFPHLGLDVDNLVCLSHQAHEIVHGRMTEPAEKLTKERW